MLKICGCNVTADWRWYGHGLPYPISITISGNSIFQPSNYFDFYFSEPENQSLFFILNFEFLRHRAWDLERRCVRWCAFHWLELLKLYFSALLVVSISVIQIRIRIRRSLLPLKILSLLLKILLVSFFDFAFPSFSFFRV